MKKRNIIQYIISLIIILLITSQTTYAFSYGVLPSKFDVGQINKGEEIDFIFYLSTTLDYTTQVRLHIEKQSPNFFKEDYSKDGIEFKKIYATMANAKDWIEFKENPVLVDPENKQIIELDSGGVAVVNKKVEAKLKIPLDAEPGTYVLNLIPQPENIGASGVGAARMVGIPVIFFIFTVNPIEQVKHEFNLEYIDVKRTDKKRVDVTLNLKNTGSTTTQINNEKSNFAIYSQTNQKLFESKFGYGTEVKPNEQFKSNELWTNYKDDIKDGVYTVRGEVHWYSGGFNKFEESIFVPSYIEQPTIEQDPTIRDRPSQDSQKDKLPLWILIIGIITSIIIYSRKKKLNILIPIILIIIYGIAMIILWNLGLSNSIYTKFITILISILIIYSIW